MSLHPELAQNMPRHDRVDGAGVYEQAKLPRFPRISRVRNDDIDKSQAHDSKLTLTLEPHRLAVNDPLWLVECSPTLAKCPIIVGPNNHGGIDFGNSGPAALGHGDLDLLAENVQHANHALLAAQGQAPKKRTADKNRLGS